MKNILREFQTPRLYYTYVKFVKDKISRLSIKILFLGFSVEGMAQIVLKSNDYLQKEDTSLLNESHFKLKEV